MNLERLTTTNLVLAPDASIDLQMHTTYSDGEWIPEQLVDYLVQEHFGLVAITDHDRVDTVPALQQLAFQKGLPILVAAEMSTSWRGEGTDLLCYGFDSGNKELRELAEDVQRRQQDIIQKTYANLSRKGYTFPNRYEVLKAHGGELLQPTDLFILLEKHGYWVDKETSWKDVVDAGFSYVHNDTAAVVEAVHHSGGVCLIAHPGRGAYETRYDASLLDQLRQEVPIDGFEAHYPTHTQEQTTMYLEYAQKHDLLISSGSDSHRPEDKPIKYRAELSRRLLERLNIQVR